MLNSDILTESKIKFNLNTVIVGKNITLFSSRKNAALNYECLKILKSVLLKVLVNSSNDSLRKIEIMENLKRGLASPHLVPIFLHNISGCSCKPRVTLRQEICPCEQIHLTCQKRHSSVFLQAIPI